jgi:hypothetical protein
MNWWRPRGSMPCRKPHPRRWESRRHGCRPSLRKGWHRRCPVTRCCPSPGRRFRSTHWYTTPFSFAIHTRLRRSASRFLIQPAGAPGAVTGYGRNRTPSKRPSPVLVATHRKTSGVCPMPTTVLSGKPSSDCQVRIAHGSSAEAGTAARASTHSRLTSQCQRPCGSANTGAA